MLTNFCSCLSFFSHLKQKIIYMHGHSHGVKISIRNCNQLKIKSFWTFVCLFELFWCRQKILFMQDLVSHNAKNSKTWFAIGFLIQSWIWLNKNVQLMFVVWVDDMKQEREYKEALDTFNEKNHEKVQLITKLTEVSFEFLVLESHWIKRTKPRSYWCWTYTNRCWFVSYFF